ncbi:hypothetical protein C1J01_46795 [Nonomuraea aridisoli]|uniref:Uncharacterized protein n=1 Tax=Nonomuraea aridisoli TaxID=2070368 RepID=A0A2W2DGG9_9ACTN|nr:hypothetical protein C1J01_46795 [Nonomuraea aridisoli]
MVPLAEVPDVVTPTVEETPAIGTSFRRPEPPARRGSPLGSVLLTVVVVTAITSATAVAFRAR